MSALIELPYKDFLILYSELDNTWIPKRSSGALPACTSLTKAKESIDNLSKQEKSSFIRHDAIFMANDFSDPVLVTVTSFVAKPGRYSLDKPYLSAWIKLPDGHRQCENVKTLRELSEENQKALSEYGELKKATEKLRAQGAAMRSKITPYVLSPANKVYSSKEVPADVAALLPKE